MQKFDWFVLPFTVGLIFLIAVLFAKYFGWINKLAKSEKLKIKTGLLSVKSLQAAYEVVLESLLHRKIFKTNPLLGYMHASLAFGWFLLIVIGNLESRLYYNGEMSAPYVPIFFRFFNPNPTDFNYHAHFAFAMDLILAIVLTGVMLAWVKRTYSRMFGMKKTTQLQWGDKLALSTLWFIFPLRFLAESFTSATFGGGSFLTATSGQFFGSILPVQSLAYPAWWAYSAALCLFFVALPFSRYMHIPTEVVLIFLRKYGVSEKEIHTSFTKVELNACSRCGICIDSCQLASSANIKDVQSVYYLQNLRYNNTQSEQTLNCFMCGRCDKACPVGIDIASIRQAGRTTASPIAQKSYNYIPDIYTSKTEVLYFAGCMTHLQPGTKKSMVHILDTAKVNYKFMDEDKSICCGRPLMLSGKKQQADELMEKNKQIILASGAQLLVTSCPICYKVFNEEYGLSIKVMHHSEYLLQLVNERKIYLRKQKTIAVYHDPCELGRGSGIYDQPRKLLQKALVLNTTTHDKEKALCCGGSLANFKITMDDRKKVTADALRVLTASAPETLVTGCPLCKKTFGAAAQVKVADIAEIISTALITDGENNRVKKVKRVVKVAAVEIG